MLSILIPISVSYTHLDVYKRQSKDSAKSHQGFIAKQELPFNLIADTDTALQQAFGVWAEKKLYGRSYMGTLRTTFIINERCV